MFYKIFGYGQNLHILDTFYRSIRVDLNMFDLQDTVMVCIPFMRYNKLKKGKEFICVILKICPKIRVFFFLANTSKF